ncbi:sensor histidine kinase [Larkinella terrae]|uniref:GHKL domain-containing protein n=1 Tax=Larkinella terrae TaxID=2025311 RepID=A0A7K0ETV5_9BACT|nr:histidine kinase [Larkinella terrae]MRS65209.1 GHKL domain-containing protein [Larkinella terrae]
MNALALNRSNGNWFFKYKIYHIPFWFLYNYLWWVVAVGNPYKAVEGIFFSPYFIKFLFYFVFQAIGAYFNLYVLIPKYLEKNRLVEYIIYLVLTIILASLLIIPGYYLTAAISGRTMNDQFGGGTDAECFYRFLGNALPSMVASMTLAMSIKLTKNWVQSRQRQQLLEKEKLETELKFLKYQFNPHFLFNTINSIFFLIHKNPDMASDSLAKFSEMLRHQLYESNDQKIPLNKEIAYLENFIELEKLRQNNNVNVSVQLGQQFSGHLGIAPFILMNFVENAFKHVSKHTDQPNWIRINLSMNQQQLDFSIANSASQLPTNEVINFGGIGIQNVQRRLDLIYPGEYSLDIQHNDNSFSVELRLMLSELDIPQFMEKAV